MRYLKTGTVPLIVEIVGMIKKGTDKHVIRSPSSHSLSKIHTKITLCGTAHSFRIIPSM